MKTSKIIYRLTLLYSLTFLLYSCDEDPSPDQQNEDKPEYKFSNPERVIGISPLPGVFQHAYISNSKIFYLTFYNIKTMVLSNTSFNNRFEFTFNDQQATTSRRELMEKSGPFTIDHKEEYMYVIVNSHLYQCNLKNLAIKKITDISLGKCLAIRVLDNGDVILTTDLNNGSIQKIPSGKNTLEIIASDLGSNPTSFEVSDQYYFVNLSQVVGSSVKKISQTGEVTTLISDITAPEKIVSDNHGNLIIQSRISIDNNLYFGFSIYDNVGEKISEIFDTNNNQILGTGIWSTSVQLYIDEENKLYFGHNDHGQNSYINPKNSGELERVDIYKMQLSKQ